jgi:hypothetical protein
MSMIRENIHKQLTSHKVATMLVCTCLPARMSRTKDLGIFVAWPKEAVP